MTTIRLDVWRPLSYGRALHYAGDTPYQKELFHEQIYSWAPTDDIWGGMMDEQLRSELRERLLTTFAPNRAPRERMIGALSSIAETLREIAAVPEMNEWMTSSETVGSNPDSIAIRIAPTLALLHRLQWIVESFRDVPDATITVR